MGPCSSLCASADPTCAVGKPDRLPRPAQSARSHLTQREGGVRVLTDAEADMPLAEASGAICVQRFDGSRNSAIHTTYRISLRSSSLREPRYPLLRVVFGLSDAPAEAGTPIVFSSLVYGLVKVGIAVLCRRGSEGLRSPPARAMRGRKSRTRLRLRRAPTG